MNFKVLKLLLQKWISKIKKSVLPKSVTKALIIIYCHTAEEKECMQLVQAVQAVPTALTAFHREIQNKENDRRSIRGRFRYNFARRK
jgi:hypothetical protein